MRRILLFLGCVLAALSALPGVASAAGLHVPDDATVPSRPIVAPLRDAPPATPSGQASAARSAPASMAQAQTYFAQDGQAVRVDVSKNLQGATRDAVQGYVNFLGSRMHGKELKRLTVFILTASEVRQACSETALACYIPKLELMIIPGEQTPEGEVPVEYVITHEYGHHVARNRRNDPFPAISYGPKYWATQEGICAGVRGGSYFPGDQGKNYIRNPGENFAEAFAQLQYRDRGYPWQYDRSLTPDDGAYAAIARDVGKPWASNRARRRTGRLSAGRRSKTFAVSTALDGTIKLSLRGPRRANYDVQILSRGRIVARTKRRGSRDVLTATDCSVRTFSVRVVRRSGSGGFSVRVQTPG